MNWRLSQLDRMSIISSSDAHSPANMGREATIFELEKLSYKNLMQGLKQQGGIVNKISYTIEFYPEEGRYHWDGHRNCGIQFSPTETNKQKGVCPKCKKRLTIGVLNRVGKLADRDEGYQPTGRPLFKSLVPLREIISKSIGKGVNTKSVAQEYEDLIEQGDNEFNVLLNLSPDQLKEMTLPKIADGITKVRSGDIKVTPG